MMLMDVYRHNIAQKCGFWLHIFDIFTERNCNYGVDVHLKWHYVPLRINEIFESEIYFVSGVVSFI